MKPDVGVVMQGFFGTLLGDVAPHLSAEYSMGHVGIMGLMLHMTGELHDRAADIRLAENSEMRSLFSHAAALVEDEALKQRLTSAAETLDASLRISVLEANNAELAALLIELQTHVEGSQASWAAGLEARIWDYLVATMERRELPFPSFA